MLYNTIINGFGTLPRVNGPFVGSVLEPALAANLSHVQLYMPTSANEIFAHLHQLLLWTDVASVVQLYDHGVALANQDGTDSPMDSADTDPSQATVRSQQNVALLPPGANLKCEFPTQAGVPLVLPVWFHRAANNTGWTLVPNAVNVALHVTFWWQEHIYRTS